MLTLEHLQTFCHFIEKSGWLTNYDFWLLGSFPKVVDGSLPGARDIDVAVVNKADCHNRSEISQILKLCKEHMGDQLDIYYRPNLNKDLDSRGLDAIWTSRRFWGDPDRWPTKLNYHGWRVRNYRPLELWYSVDNTITVRYVLFPTEKHVERVIDGHVYAEPILLNTYIQGE